MQQHTRHTLTFQSERTGMVQLIETPTTLKVYSHRGGSGKSLVSVALWSRLSWHRFQLIVQSLNIKALSPTDSEYKELNKFRLKEQDQ